MVKFVVGRLFFYFCPKFVAMFYRIFSVLPMIVSLFWIVMLLLDNQKNRSKKFFILLLTIILINFIAHAAYFNHEYETYTVLDTVWVFTSLMIFPLYYYYIRLLTTDAAVQHKWAWLAVPSLLLAIYSAVIYLLMTPAEVESFIQGVMYQQSGYEPYSRLVRLQILRGQLFKILFSVQVILSLFFGFRLIDKYNKKVKTFYSNIGGKDMTPMKWAAVALSVVSLVSVLANSIGNSYFIARPGLLFIPFAIYSVCIFFSAYVSYMQRFTIEHFTKNINEYEFNKVFTGKKNIVRYHTPGLDNLKSLRERLIYLLEKMEIFKNPELKISDVSLLLKTNRTYVSKVVNEELNTNFCDLVNSYRVSYAEELLCSPLQDDSPSIAEIAEISGFSSESSFYRVFKNKNGVSPGVYRQQRCNALAVNG